MAPSRMMVTGKPIVVFLLLLAAAFAGCLGGGEDDVDGPGGKGPGNGDAREPGVDGEFLNATTTGIEQGLDAIQIVPEGDPEWIRPNVTEEDWLVLSSDRSDGGTVSGYKWEFPKAAVMESAGQSAPFFLLDIAVTLGPMGASDGLGEGEDWLLLVVQERFDEDFNTWELAQVDYVYGATMTRTTGPFGQDETSTVVPSAAPFTVRVPYDEEIHGDTIYFVLAARGSGEVGLGVRMLSPAFSETVPPASPSQNWGDFQGSVGEKAPYVPERTGDGDGLYIARYFENRTMASTATREITTDMTEPDDTIPTTDFYQLTSARAVTLRSGVDWGGWSRVNIGYVSILEAGEWVLEGSVHGHDVDREARFDHTHSLPGGDPPAMGLRATIDGADPTELENRITKTGSLSETLRFEHVSIGERIPAILDSDMPFRNSLF